MSDIKSDLPRFHLDPGRIVISHSPLLVTTILGSCVSVVMVHQKRAIGAMCHGLLPSCRCGGDYPTNNLPDDCFRYVDCSIRYLLHEFGNLNIAPKELTIKLFGGSDMFSSGLVRSVGQQNVQIAREVLRKNNLHISSEDVGSEQGRKLFFFSHTGEVRLKRLGKSRENIREFQEELAAIRQFTG